ASAMACASSNRLAAPAGPQSVSSIVPATQGSRRRMARPPIDLILSRHTPDYCVDVPNLCGSVRYDEPVSCIIFIKGKQLGIATLPFAGFKIAPQLLQSGFGIADGPEGRAAGSDLGIEIGGRPAPVGIEESIAAIVRHQNRCDLHRTQPSFVVGQRWH